MGPNIEPCGIPDRSIGKALSVSFMFYTLFHVLSMDTQNLLLLLIKQMHEDSQQVNH